MEYPGSLPPQSPVRGAGAAGTGWAGPGPRAGCQSRTLPPPCPAGPLLSPSLPSHPPCPVPSRPLPSLRVLRGRPQRRAGRGRRVRWHGFAALWRGGGPGGAGMRRALCMPGQELGPREWVGASSPAIRSGRWLLTSLLRVDPHGASSAASPYPIASLLIKTLKLYHSVIFTPVPITYGSDTLPVPL